MRPQPARLHNPELEQRPQQLEILRPAHHELHQGQVIHIQREDIPVADDRMQPTLPADGKRFDNLRAQDVGVITVALLEQAVVPDRVFQ